MSVLATTRSTRKLAPTATSVPKATATLSQLAKAIVLPSYQTPIRIPTYPNVERTAVLPFRSTASAVVPESIAGGVPAIGYTDFAFMFCGAPAVPAWRTYAVTAIVDTSFATLTDTPASLPTTAGSFWLTSGQSAAGAAAGNGLPITLLATSLPIGMIGGDSYAYLPPTPSAAANAGIVRYVKVSLTGGNIVSGNLVATVRWWAKADETIVEHISLAPSGTSMFIGRSANAEYGTFAFGRLESVTVGSQAINWTAPSQLSFLMGWATTTDIRAFTGIAASGVSSVMLPLLAAQPQSAVSTVPWSDTKLTACSALISNVTKVMNKEGTVNCARINVNQGPYGQVVAAFCPTDTTMISVHPSMRYFGPLENGLYTFLPHSAETAEFFDTTGGGLEYPFQVRPSMDLTRFEYANVVLIKDPDATTPTNLAITLDMHVEFRTSSTIFPIAVAATGLDAYHQATAAVARICPFWENIIHVPSVLSALSALLPVAEKLWSDYEARKMARKAAQLQLNRQAQAPVQQRTQPTSTRVQLPPAGFLPRRTNTRKQRKQRRQQRRRSKSRTVRRP